MLPFTPPPSVFKAYHKSLKKKAKQWAAVFQLMPARQVCWGSRKLLSVAASPQISALIREAAAWSLFILGGREREARWKEGTFKSYVGIETPHTVASVGKSPIVG